jgi:hypothetical protein
MEEVGEGFVQRREEVLAVSAWVEEVGAVAWGRVEEGCGEEVEVVF